MQTALRGNLSKGRMNTAFSILETMVAGNARLTDRVRLLRDNYKALAGYAMAGIEDPGRERILADISSETLQIAGECLHSALSIDNPKLCFAKWRYARLHPESLDSLVSDYLEVSSALSLALLGGHADAAGSSGESLSARRIALAGKIFDSLWISPGISREDSAAVERLLDSDIAAEDVKEMALWALMLGGMEFYNENRFLLLSQAYCNVRLGRRLRLVALTGFVLLGALPDYSFATSKAQTMLESMRGTAGWLHDLRSLACELMKTRDTARISQKIRDEIFPAMIKLHPDLEKLGERGEELFSEESGVNPEWEELLDKSGLGDKMRELGELQSEGADMMMATFSGLKSFPFFNEVANWFTPFSLDRPEVAGELSGRLGAMVEILARSSVLCDSDKYSIVLSLERLPAAQRDMFFKQMQEQEATFSELRRGSLDTEDTAAVTRAIVQNLYRFFKLYRRKGEFNDPFARGINLFGLGQFREELHEESLLAAAAEFYFKRGYYEEAAPLFEELRRVAPDEALILQKTGYCYANMGQLDKAISSYEKSRVLRPDSLWTLRRLATAYRMTGELDKALECYRHLETLKPEDAGIALNIGHCLLGTGNPQAALKSYYKADYLNPSSGKAKRPIAWCAFLTGDLDKASAIIEPLLQSDPLPVDWLNAGHIALAAGKPALAVKRYSRFVELKDPESFEKSMADDTRALKDAGIDNTLINIVIDETLG